MPTPTRDQVSSFLSSVAERDSELSLFGASAHRYELGAPLSPARLAAVEQALGTRLPDDYREFITTVAASGAGPGYGLVTVDHPAQLHEAARKDFVVPVTSTVTGAGITSVGHSDYTPNQEGMILLADHGCTKLSFLVVRGEDVGAVYYDLRSLDEGFVRGFDSFSEWYSAWSDEIDEGAQSRQWGEPASCAAPRAISSYLSQISQKLHGDPGAELSDDELGEALHGINAGGIDTATGADRFFGDQSVRLCASCQGMVDRFVGRGLMEAEVIKPGDPPKPEARRGQAPGGGAASGGGAVPGGGAGAGGGGIASQVLMPGTKLPTLGDYVAFMKEVQRGDMMGALSRRGMTMMDYGGVAAKWGQLIGSRPDLTAEFGRLLSGG
ncbi:MAG: SMI1/KNR4 family protein [Deltaproteobacteria bacterium]|nr:SMI1/KNR4 family protein [Deltaproteobacteria bacterium]